MLGILIKIFKILNSESSPPQIALAVALAAFVGLTPFLTLQNLFIIIIVCLLRVNFTAFLLAWPLFFLLSFILSPIIEQIGAMVLNNDGLQAMWTSFYNSLTGRLSYFYSTHTMGGFIVALVLFAPVYLGVQLGVDKYRTTWAETISNTPLIKALKASKLISKATQMYNG